MKAFIKRRMWLSQSAVVPTEVPTSAPDSTSVRPAPASERTLVSVLLQADLSEVAELCGGESFAEAAAVLQVGRPKLMAWFKQRGATLTQRQAATNAISKALKEKVEEKKEKKKVAEKPNDALAPSDAHTYLLCRSKQPVRSVPNLRDVSWAHTSLRPGVVIRCGCVDFCSARDAALLVDELGVRLRIDLRTPRELPDCDGLSRWFCDAHGAPRACPNAMATRSEICCHHLPVDGMLGEDGRIPALAEGAVGSELGALADQMGALPPPSIQYSATSGLGQEASAVHARMYKQSTYGASVTAASTALASCYLRMAEANAEVLSNALRLIAEAEGVVLLHSSAGKDRTGVVCALALLLCDVPLEAVCRDYALSGGIKQMLYASEVADTEERVLRRLGGESAELCCSASVLVAFVHAITARHGSFALWLAEHGRFGPDDVAKLRSRLMQPSTALGAGHET